MTQFDAFGNDSQVLTIGGLTIENSPSQIAIYGELNLNLDADGYQKAQALQAFCDGVLTAFEQKQGTQETASQRASSDTADNPFL